MKVLGLFFMAVAVAGFYLLFFKLAPWIGGLIPPTEWTPFLKVMVYVVIGWSGGVVFPVFVFVWGIIVFTK